MALRICHEILEPRGEYVGWKIYLDGDGLESILKVEYQLGPLFTPSTVARNDFQNKFEFVAESWGESEIRVDIFFRGRDVPVRSEYFLTLDRSNLEGKPVPF